MVLDDLLFLIGSIFQKSYISTKRSHEYLCTLLLVSQIIFLHFILFLLIFLLPQKAPISNNFYNTTNSMIKKYAFFLTLMIRAFFLKNSAEIITEYLLYFICIKRNGTLRAFSYVVQNGFNTSGHLFLFSYSCYLFMASILLHKTVWNVVCIIAFIVYTFMGMRTIVYYHKKTECVVSALNSFFICILHDFLIN